MIQCIVYMVMTTICPFAKSIIGRENSLPLVSPMTVNYNVGALPTGNTSGYGPTNMAPMKRLL